jgi:integrase
VSIKRISSGKYQARFHAPGGKHPQKTFDLKRDAEAWLAEQRRSIRLNTYVDTRMGKIKLSEVFEEFINTKSHLAPKSLADYQSLWSCHLQSTFALLPLEAITFNLVQKWAHAAVTGPKAYTSATRINKAQELLSAVLHHAVDNQYLARNPLVKSNGTVAKVVSYKVDRKRPKRFLDPEELMRLASCCGRYECMVLVAGVCGLRWGELVGLQVRDVDLNSMTLTVTRSVTEVSGRFSTKSTKSGQSRQIRIPDFLSERLAQQIAGKFPSALVFPNKNGKPLSNNNFRRDFFEPAVKQAGLGHLTPKDLRDTAASIAISGGASVLAVANMLGHSDPSITMRIYAHLFSSDQDLLAKAISGKFINCA